jgi:beta-glucosidase
VDLSQLPEFINDQLAVTYDYYHGYRHVDRENIDPQFPFGFGLSYTTFSYDGITLGADRVGMDDELFVSVDVTNTGSVAGEEVVQLYVSYDGSAVDRPVRELKSFARVHLEPGESRSVGLVLRIRDLAYYDDVAGAWLTERIPHTVYAGSSSRDLPLSATFNVQ